jgi:hypothetical protein
MTMTEANMTPYRVSPTEVKLTRCAMYAEEQKSSFVV